MAFQTKNLESQITALVEVGSFRVKVCVCEFKNDKVHILAYGEKRQSTSYFVNGECQNLEMLASAIKDTLQKTEKQYNISIQDVVINFPFGELFFYGNKLSYKREEERELISKDELQKILRKIEKLILEKCFSFIEKKSGYIEDDIKLIISSISDIKIDTQIKEKIIGSSGKSISVSIVNMFIPIQKNNIIKYIGEIINKNITKIIPTELSLRNLFSDKDLVIVHLGAIYTTITVKSEEKIIGISKVPIGVQDLTNMIAIQHKETLQNIIKNIDTGKYNDIEQKFIDTWKEGLMVGISEILGNKVCPKKFYILSDIKTNFIENEMEKVNFKEYNIKLVKKISFISFKEKYVESQIENCDDFEISIEIAAMILELKNIIKKEKSLLVKTLKKAVVDLGYMD